MSDIEYISLKDTAKIVRDALKKAFPSVKFSVRGSSYANGSSIHVSWIDGPTVEQVAKISEQYEGAYFDGMKDLKTYIVSEYNGKTVRFGADFIFHNRTISNFNEKHALALELIRLECKVDIVHGREKFGNRLIDSLANQILYAQDYTHKMSLIDSMNYVLGLNRG